MIISALLGEKFGVYELEIVKELKTCKHYRFVPLTEDSEKKDSIFTIFNDKIYEKRVVFRFKKEVIYGSHNCWTSSNEFLYHTAVRFRTIDEAIKYKDRRNKEMR